MLQFGTMSRSRNLTCNFICNSLEMGCIVTKLLPNMAVSDYLKCA